MKILGLQNKYSFRFLLGLLFISILFALFISPRSASASYDGGRLIDNAVLLDANSMTAQDIQNFLVSKGSGLASRSFLLNCYGPTSQERQLYTSVGAPCDQTIPASHIIYFASQIYGINPRAVLATLQKEQSLITSPNPTDWQINQAMGYACPTSGQCGGNSTFGYQIDSGVWVIRYHYERANGNMSWWSQSTSWTCGTQKNFYSPNLYPNQNVNFYDEDGVMYRTHYIANAATSSLYCYTPHAYNNPQGLYGRAAYGTTGRYYSGSYNFVYYYELWFGTTHNADYSWSLVSQTVHTDEMMTMPTITNNLNSGSRIFATVKLRNTGNQTWSNSGPNPVRIGTVRNYERQSVFCDTTWISCSRPATMLESTVTPGSTATFSFWLKTPYYGVQSSEYFAPLIEGIRWMQDIGLQFNISVQQPTFKWQLTGQQAYTDNTKQQIKSLINLQPGEMSYVEIKAKNQSNLTWYNSGSNPTNLGISRPSGRFSLFFDNTWLGQNRPARLKEASVPPGMVGTFEFWMRTPNNKSGEILEYLNLVTEGASWHDDIGLNFYTSIIKADYSWLLVSQYAYYEPEKINLIGLHNLRPGQVVLIGFTALNSGNVTWRNSGPNPVNVGASNPGNRVSKFCTLTWFNCSRPTTMKETSVAPGQIGTFEFSYKAPEEAGQYLEYFDILSEGLVWMSSTGLNFSTVVVQ